jgi:hypothetical protein
MGIETDLAICPRECISIFDPEQIQTPVVANKRVKTVLEVAIRSSDERLWGSRRGRAGIGGVVLPGGMPRQGNNADSREADASDEFNWQTSLLAGPTAVRASASRRGDAFSAVGACTQAHDDPSPERRHVPCETAARREGGGIVRNRSFSTQRSPRRQRSFPIAAGYPSIHPRAESQIHIRRL